MGARSFVGAKQARRGFNPPQSSAEEICALLGYIAASSGNPLPTFQNNILVPSSRVKKSKKSPEVKERVDLYLYFLSVPSWQVKW
jgi:hypothetical protein